MTYHNNLGEWPADASWAPGAQELPRADPRILKSGTTVYGTWNVTGAACSAVSSSVPGYVLTALRARLPGCTVKLVGNGWQAGGLLKLSVKVPSNTTLGTIKGAFFDVIGDVNTKRTSGGFLAMGTGCSLTNSMTLDVAAASIAVPASTTPSTTTTTPGTTTPGTTTPTTDATLDTSGGTTGGIPTWGLVAGGAAAVGLLGFLALSMGGKKKSAPAAAPAAVTANVRQSKKALADKAFQEFGMMSHARKSGDVPISAALRYWPPGSAITRHQLERLRVIYNSDMETLDKKSAFRAVLAGRKMPAAWRRERQATR